MTANIAWFIAGVLVGIIVSCWPWRLGGKGT